MQAPISADVETGLGPAIDRTLRYYGFFRYPLTAAEIRCACEEACTEEAVRCYLEAQVAQGSIYCEDGYYANSAEVPELLERRRRGNAKAAADLEKAMRCGRLIYRFPFVRFVGISGSLSKGYSDEHTDFDFFIVTARNRLWICRTILHLFKKTTFLVGRQHDFCMNYFIDTEALRLEEQNFYTATELSSLIPVCGSDVYQQLHQANDWVRRLLPNVALREPAGVADRDGAGKRAVSAVLEALYPERLNRLLMRLTDRKWRRQWARKGYPAADYPLAFKTTLHVSKNHPANYQKRLLDILRRNDA